MRRFLTVGFVLLTAVGMGAVGDVEVMGIDAGPTFAVVGLKVETVGDVGMAMGQVSQTVTMNQDKHITLSGLSQGKAYELVVTDEDGVTTHTFTTKTWSQFVPGVVALYKAATVDEKPSILAGLKRMVSARCEERIFQIEQDLAYWKEMSIALGGG